VRIGIVPEFRDEGVSFQSRLHGGALDAPAASMDDSQFVQARAVSGVEVLVDHGGNVAWLKGMEVELGVDRYKMGIGHV
jgi:hypothetical protein